MAGGNPDIDRAASHIWEWFWAIGRGRQSGMNGWQPIPATEIQAWQQATGNIMRREEIAIIRDMDLAYLSAASKGGGTVPAGDPEPITTAAFDAVFG